MLVRIHNSKCERLLPTYGSDRRAYSVLFS
jgi:hypothetical protein